MKNCDSQANMKWANVKDFNSVSNEGTRRCCDWFKDYLKSKNVYRQFNKEMLRDPCWVRCKLFNV